MHKTPYQKFDIGLSTPLNRFTNSLTWNTVPKIFYLQTILSDDPYRWKNFLFYILKNVELTVNVSEYVVDVIISVD